MLKGVEKVLNGIDTVYIISRKVEKSVKRCEKVYKGVGRCTEVLTGVEKVLKGVERC